jgi:glycosyltransferase involved in cell wall biosynthesis
MKNQKFNQRQKRIRDIEWDAIEDTLKNFKGNFLTIGAGTGYAMHKAESLGFQVYGIEPSLNEHGVVDPHIKEVANKIQQGCAEQLPFPDHLSQKDMLITIFTATYKGEHLLPTLFASLMRQTRKNFEWILVNDGSPDHTDDLVQEMQAKADFPLYYYKKNNGGKTTAVNLGIQLAKGEMWFMVDHDDFLGDKAIEMINQYYPQIKNNEELCGITFLRHNHKGNPIGTQKNPDNIITDYCTYRTVFNVIGDRAEVVKTNYFRKHCPIPTFENENNCLDGYVWLMLAKEYKALFIANKDPIYYCEYLPTGRSTKIYNTPLGDMCINNLFASMKQTSYRQKLLAYVRYWYKFFIAKNMPFCKAYRDMSHKWGIITLPLGVLAFWLKRKNHYCR